MDSTPQAAIERVPTPPATVRPAWVRHLPWLPIPLLVALSVALRAHDSVSFEPRLLLPTLNLVFVTGISLLVAWLAARSYVLGESVAVLLLGCGVLAFGVGNAEAAAATFFRMDADIGVTLHNTAAFVGAVCCLISACLAADPGRFGRVARHARAAVARTYALVLALVIVWTVAEVDDLVPPFFLAGGGPTMLRQIVLGSSVGMFAVSAIIFRVLGTRSPSPFLSWYSLALLLIAMGLAIVFTQHTVGSAVSWVGRSAQYLGCVYLYVAIRSVPTGPKPWGIPLGQMLRETGDRYRSLVEFSPDPILVHSDGKYVFANPAAARLLHASSVDDILGRRVMDIIHPDDRDTVRHRIEQVGSGTATPLRELKVVRLDGSPATVESTAARVEFRGRPAFQVVLRDVTERKRIEEALQSGERRLRSQNAVLEGINSIFREALACETEEQLGTICLRVAEQVTGSEFGFVGEMDENGRLNDIAISDPGWAACGMEDQDGHRRVPAGFRVHGLYGRVFRLGEPFFTNDPPSHPDSIGVPAGHPRLKAFLGAPLVHQGRTIGIVAVANRPGGYTEQQQDALQAIAPAIVQVFMRKRAETAMREVDRRKSEFLATLSHELRNPLEPMRYALELLNRPDTEPEARRVIERQLAHLVRLVDDLLDVTRIASNKIQIRKRRVDLAAVIRHAVEAASPEIERGRHSLAVRLPAADIWLDADADRVQQVIINLLNNAAHYTPSGGTITISAAPEGNDAVISVRDTGIGLHPHDLTRVFEMFTQIGEPGHGGLGIGLALVKGVVELHGGSVEARSGGLHQGSEFLVRLPRAQEPETLGAPTATAVAPDLSPTLPAGERAPLRILVVDDNFDAAQMMKTFLEIEGHEVRIACDGVSALAALRDFDAQVGLFDIGLPGMDGYELARHVRHERGTGSIYLVAVTGWGQESDRQQARDSGFDAHLTKPADPEELNRLLAAASRPAADSATT